MENNKGFALGCFGGYHRKEDHEELMAEYRRKRANADKVEAALMAACGEIAERLEKDAKSMNLEMLKESIGALAGVASVLTAFELYAAKPLRYDFEE